MLKNFYKKGKNLIVAPQSSIFSAATIIMVMVLFSKILGFARQRVLLSLFPPHEAALFFASFRLPDLLFEVLTYGALSSAFIPVFTKLLKKDEADAWKTAAYTANIGLLVFTTFAIIFGIFANPLYALVAPGYEASETQQIAEIARILFAAQGFFVVSYVMTGVLESMRRFLIPALAPIFYNLGFIVGTLLLHNQLGLVAPAIGVVFGAFIHFMIQLPLAYKLGFRFLPTIKLTRDVKKIGKLALPRMVELSMFQISKTLELSLATLISASSYTYYTLANSLQLLPIGVFGVSLAKAALPTLTRQADDDEKFRKTFLSTLYQVMFLVLPFATALIVLRIPVVRILFGTKIFSWQDTVQTGFALSAFAVGIPFQTATLLLSRAFYARHNTKTPVIISLFGSAVFMTTGWYLVRLNGLPTWGLSLAVSLSMAFQAVALFTILSKQLNGGTFFAITPIIKSTIASIGSGVSMFIILKLFDRSVWVKRLSFLIDVQQIKNLPFDSFVLDTRYTLNLIVLTIMTGIIGMAVYGIISYLLKSKELLMMARVLKAGKFAGVPARESEPVSPSSSDTTAV